MNPRSLAVAAALAVSPVLGAPPAPVPSPVVPASDVTQGDELVHDVCDKGHADELKKLLDAKPALRDVKNIRGATPLHFAAKNPDVEVLKLLIARGANVNAADDEGFTPLHMAAFERHAEHTRLLLEAGADVQAKTKYGRTPLSMAEKARADECAGVLSIWILKNCQAGQDCGVGSPREVKKLVK